MPCLEMKNVDYNPSGQGGLHRAKSNVGLGGDVELTETRPAATAPAATADASTTRRADDAT